MLDVSMKLVFMVAPKAHCETSYGEAPDKFKNCNGIRSLIYKVSQEDDLGLLLNLSDYEQKLSEFVIASMDITDYPMQCLDSPSKKMIKWDFKSSCIIQRINTIFS